MIKLSNTRLLILLCFLASLSILSSCKQDKDENSGIIQLLSFGPTGTQHGDTLRFFGTNLNKVTAIQFTGPNVVVNQNEFKQQTSEEILLIVPAAAEKGYVTLKTPQGDIVTKTQLNFGVTISVASITPQARPGENITITGDFLNWVSQVTFSKDKVVTNFVSQSINQLVVKVPDDAQTGPLVLKYQGTDSSELETADTLKVSLPVATNMSPNPVKHADNLTITGTNLDLIKKITFTGVSTPVTTFVSQTATQLVVKVPGQTLKGKLTFEVLSGVQVVTTTDLDVVMPAITNLTPNPIDIGADLTITGTNLDLVTAISFIGVLNPVTTFVSKTPTQIVVNVPTGAITGKLTFTVANTIHTVKSANDLGIIGSSVPPKIIYDDAVTSTWNGWIGGGWGGTKDLNNTSPVRSGAKSVKIDYTSGAYGVPLQLGGANIPLGGYTSLKVSIYGGVGSNGKSVNVGFNEADGKTITIVEGAWTDFVIPLSQISATSTLTHLYFKNYSASGAFTIYLDDLGIY